MAAQRRVLVLKWIGLVSIIDHNSFKPAPTNYNTRVDLINKHGVVIGSADRKDLT